MLENPVKNIVVKKQAFDLIVNTIQKYRNLFNISFLHNMLLLSSSNFQNSWLELTNRQSMARPHGVWGDNCSLFAKMVLQISLESMRK